MRNKIIRGIPASPGIVLLKAFLYNEEFDANEIHLSVNTDKILESEKFEKALAKTRKEIKSIESVLAERIEGTKVAEESLMLFRSQFSILEDKKFIENIVKKIKEGKRASEAIKMTVSEINKEFGKINESYLKARIVEIKDVAKRIIKNLEKKEKRIKKDEKYKYFCNAPYALIGKDFSPSVFVKNEKIKGIVTDLGTQFSHSAIMARALKIPAVVGVKNITSLVNNGVELLIDGNQGIVIIEPDESTRRVYEEKIKHFQEYEEELKKLSELPAKTIDGQRIELACNIEIPEEVDVAIKYGINGIGLLRTEFIYLRKGKLPSIDEQYNIYYNIGKKIYPEPLIIRAFDFGKINVLGCRGIRYLLLNKDIFLSQLMAIAKTQKELGNVKILFPMITTQEEIMECKSYVEKLEKELNVKLEIGTMIETPSAAIMAERIAKFVDFLSIGSNDLTQYILACDRNNPNVNYLYNPLHPAVIYLIKRIIEGGHSRGKWVGCCGELASNPIGLLTLLGLGIDEVSVSPIYVLKTKKIIRSVSIDEIKSIPDEIEKIESNAEFNKFVNELKEKFIFLNEE